MNEKDYLPLTETSFFILLSLAISPKHGYAIIKEVESMSDQRVILATGTLYSALRRMLDDGWIMRVNNITSDDGARQRKLYRLTELGQRILQAETERLQKLAALTRLRDAREER
jgi:DNA-binding PadR family transcriptional regulator